MADLIVLAVVAVLLFLAGRHIWRVRRAGGCAGCAERGTCEGGCHGCDGGCGCK